MSKRKKSGAIIESDSDDSGSEADTDEVFSCHFTFFVKDLAAVLASFEIDIEDCASFLSSSMLQACSPRYPGHSKKAVPLVDTDQFLSAIAATVSHSKASKENRHPSL